VPQVVVGGFIGNADCKATANSDIRKHFLSKQREPGGRAAPHSEMKQDASSMLSTIVGELWTSTAAVSSTQVENLVQQLLDVDRIFVCGMGRSGFAMRGLAMRLSHLGIATHFVGEVTTPPIGPRDLLLLGSGSGGTASLVNHAQTAAKVGARVSLFTVDSGSPLGRLSVETNGVIVTLPAPTPKLEGGGASCGAVPSAQPMGTLFEQT
jgi:6-phospho-3-hexuloisomerase